MQLTVLGSGNLFPTKTRYPSAYLLDAGRSRVLLDCGHCALSRLTELDIDLRSIDAVFLSHFHADHAADAFPLVYARFVADMQEDNQFREIKFIGPKGTKDNWEKWRSVYWPHGTGDYPLSFDESENSGFVGELDYSAFPVDHNPHLRSIGFNLIQAGKRAVYTGDVAQSQDLESLARQAEGADLLVVDAYGRENNPSHLTLDQVARLAEAAKPKQTLLTHLLSYPEEEARIKDFTNQEKSFIIAKDKMVLDI